MPRDIHDQEVTAAGAEAVAHLDRTIHAYLGFRLDTGEHLKAAFAADPEMPYGLALRGYFMKLFGVPALDRKAEQSLAAAKTAAQKRGASERERLHISALDAWCRGRFGEAAERWERILLEWPRDAVALRLAQFVHFYQGHSQAMRDSGARVQHAWTPDVPDYGFVQGVYAFGLEEAGAYDEAERAGRTAIEHNPADIWACHAVAHVFEMTGRQREGIEWIEGLAPHFDGTNNMRFHVWWHKALFHLELEQLDAVLELYDTRYRAERTDEYLDITNACAMLWRLEDRGVDVGERWTELADKAAARTHDNILAFIDAHFAMALAAAGRDDATAELHAAMRQAGSASGTEAPVYAEVAIPLCEAIAAYRAGAPARAADLLLPIREEIVRIGGSHAQRDVFAQLLVESLLRAGRHLEARALLAERTARKPFSIRSWRQYADVLEATGNAPAAAEAREQAAALLAA